MTPGAVELVGAGDWGQKGCTVQDIGAAGVPQLLQAHAAHRQSLHVCPVRLCLHMRQQIYLGARQARRCQAISAQHTCKLVCRNTCIVSVTGTRHHTVWRLAAIAASSQGSAPVRPIGMQPDMSTAAVRAACTTRHRVSFLLLHLATLSRGEGAKLTPCIVSHWPQQAESAKGVAQLPG